MTVPASTYMVTVHSIFRSFRCSYLRSKVETGKLKFCAYCKLTYISPNTQAHVQNSMCPPEPKIKSTEHDAATEAHVAVTCMTPDHVGQTHSTS